MRVLVIEDEKKIASFIQRGLKEEHYAVDVAYDGEQGLFLAETNPYNLIVLDIMLPGKDGIFICRELRKKSINTPILMLTARDAVEDKVSGLDSGADDYMTKPFAFEEFLARVRSLLRRGSEQKAGVLVCKDLELNQMTHKATRRGEDIMLSSKEYALLEFLLLHQDEVVTRTMLSEQVWNEAFDSFTNVIDVHIKHLRDKVDKPFDVPYIHTIRGSGYTLSGNQP
ncbi:MAG: response regulator transcription factor [Candidatus Omnitrophica bacterium]|nr:response regulator transcription factor [Candidatus Omnitrophota bacterium]